MKGERKMKKSDLSDGDIVKGRKGNICILFNAVLHQINAVGWNWLSNYNDDLKSSFTALDIVAVSFLKEKEPVYLSKTFEDSENIIWDWEEPKSVEEMTLEQVCEELGREIKLVPEKEEKN